MTEFAFKNALEIALRYPSAHNVQPVVVQRAGDLITILQDEDRTLKIGDPHGYDNDISIGAFYESLKIGLQAQGIQALDLTELFNQETLLNGGRNLKARFQFKVAESGDPSAMAQAIADSERLIKRRSYRGKFQKANAQHREGLNELAKLGLGWNFVTERSEISRIAELYDECSYEFLKQSPYQEELFHWMRLSDKNPHYYVDGLNREALALSSIEAWFGNLLLEPKRFEKLKSIGLSKALVSEAPIIKSSLAIGAIFVDQKLSAFESGQLFVRAWSHLAEYGLYACPLSALSDSPVGRVYFEKIQPPGTRLLNLLRVGPVSREKVFRSPRINLRDILIDSVVSI